MITATTTAATSVHYASAEDFDLWQGAEGVDIMSNASGATTRDAARVEAALSRADAEINQALRQRGFAWPLSSGNPSFSILTHVAVRLAGYYLFSPRDNRDDGDGAPSGVIKANTWRRRAIDELNGLLLFGIGGADRMAASPTSPAAVD